MSGREGERLIKIAATTTPPSCPHPNHPSRTFSPTATSVSPHRPHPSLISSSRSRHQHHHHGHQSQSAHLREAHAEPNEQIALYPRIEDWHAETSESLELPWSCHLAICDPNRLPVQLTNATPETCERLRPSGRESPHPTSVNAKLRGAMFDDYFSRRSQERGERWKPFLTDGGATESSTLCQTVERRGRGITSDLVCATKLTSHCYTVVR